MTTQTTHKIIFSTLLLIFSIQLIAQRTITGTVTDAETGEALIAANVLVEGTTTGTVTNIEGKYSIEVPEGSKNLVFSYTGYTTKTVTIGTENTIDVALVTGVDTDEVVVVGYGTTSKIKGKVAGVAAKVRSSRVKRDVATFSDALPTMSKSEISSYSDAADYSPAAEYETTTKSSIKSGTLTAGEIHDFSKWELWNDITENELKQYQDTWNILFKHRYTVQVMNKQGMPVIDGEVRILNSEKEVLWTSRTDNTGKAELWLNVFANDVNPEEAFNAEVEYNGKTHKINNLNTFHNGVNTLMIDVDCNVPDQVDVMFVVDATGSMGDEIRYLQIELADVIDRMQKENSDLNINLGSVFYRDHSDEYLTRKSNLSDNINQTLEFIKAQRADGGGDFPEAVEDALDVAINEMKWSENAVARLLFLVLDAPPHQNETVRAKLEEMMTKASKHGIRIIPVTGSGINKSTEYLMRSLALGTNGTYTFLTDHSGVGNPHIEPTTDDYKVEKLNDLLVRLYKQYTSTLTCEENPIFVNNDDENPNENGSANDKILALSYYPNPTTGNLTIELKEDLDEIFVTDANGKIIQRHGNLLAGKTPIDLSQFPSGMYFLRYSNGEKTGTKKVLVVH